MAVSSDIIASWRRPRVVMRRLLDMGQREDRALAFVMSACFLVFIAQWPRLSREAHLAGQELSQRISYELVSWLVVWPLVLYIFAVLLWAVLRLAGSAITPYGVRLSVFWSLLATTPAMLLYGLMRGFIGPGPEANLIGGVWVAGLLFILIQSLREAATQKAPV